MKKPKQKNVPTPLKKSAVWVKKRALSSYDKLKVENEKKEKEISDLISQNEKLKDHNYNLKEYIKELEAELKNRPECKIEEVVNTEKIDGAKVIVTAQGLKDKLITLKKDRQSVIHKFDDDINTLNLEIETYIANRHNEIDILTKL